MRVRVITSFAGPHGSFAPGEEFDLPEGADWLDAGLVEAVEPEKPKGKAGKKQADEQLRDA